MAGFTPCSWWGDALPVKLSAGAGEAAGAETKEQGSDQTAAGWRVGRTRSFLSAPTALGQQRSPA